MGPRRFGTITPTFCFLSSRSVNSLLNTIHGALPRKGGGDASSFRILEPVKTHSTQAAMSATTRGRPASNKAVQRRVSQEDLLRNPAMRKMAPRPPPGTVFLLDHVFCA